MDAQQAARLQEMWDHHEIRQLLATYCHGCDRADKAMMASVYAKESWDDHGPNKCDGKVFADLIIDQSNATTTLVSHQLGQSLITVDGDSAGAETYFIATLLYPPRDGSDRDRINQLGGRYVDRLVREEGQWRISERLCVREWSVSRTVEEDWLAKAGFIQSARGGTDVSWDALRIAPMS